MQEEKIKRILKGNTILDGTQPVKNAGLKKVLPQERGLGAQLKLHVFDRALSSPPFLKGVIDIPPLIPTSVHKASQF
ncbi:unnamed protein product [marine sediment metagenome]|uniref:Uncharacterized protein n=1 Tax=marine sediment metagenome TaxID=412755 RepID=X1EVF5_9ZZZZ